MNQEVFMKIPREGFIKLTDSRNKSLSSAQRVALNRKGNEFFLNGKFDAAKRIFLTTGYSDGLIRLGDLYSKDDPLEAYKMYKLAPAHEKAAALLEKMAMVVKNWISSGR